MICYHIYICVCVCVCVSNIIVAMTATKWQWKTFHFREVIIFPFNVPQHKDTSNYYAIITYCEHVQYTMKIWQVYPLLRWVDSCQIWKWPNRRCAKLEISMTKEGLVPRGFFDWHRLSLISAWLSNHMLCKVWNEIIHFSIPKRQWLCWWTLGIGM